MTTKCTYVSSWMEESARRRIGRWGGELLIRVVPKELKGYAPSPGVYGVCLLRCLGNVSAVFLPLSLGERSHLRERGHIFATKCDVNFY
jgi:hypothetical protein